MFFGTVRAHPGIARGAFGRGGQAVKGSRVGSAPRAFVWIGLAAILLAPGPSWAISEYQVKAAFLLNFGKYVEWPASALAPDALAICVLGTDPFGAALDQTLAGRRIGGRRLQARRVTDVSQARGCNILFVGRAKPARLDAVFSGLEGQPILLVGEQERFARKGGIINFIEVDQKIRFEINEAAARRARLKISSQLLKLATIVEDG